MMHHFGPSSQTNATSMRNIVLRRLARRRASVMILRNEHDLHSRKPNTLAQLTQPAHHTYAAFTANTSVLFASVKNVKHTLINTSNAAMVHNCAFGECKLIRTRIEAMGSKAAKTDVMPKVTFKTVES